MCIRNNDNHVHVTHLTMDGGILGYFWKTSKNICTFLIGIGIHKYLLSISSRKFWQDVMPPVASASCPNKKVFKTYMRTKPEYRLSGSG